MLTLEEACKIAAETFSKIGYYNGISEIQDFDDAWFLSSIQIGFEYNINNDQKAILMDKESGEYEITDMRHHYDQYYNADEIEVPDEFKIRMSKQIQHEKDLVAAAEAAEQATREANEPSTEFTLF